MRKLLLILFLLPIISLSQDGPFRRVRADTIKAFSTNYGTLDTQWVKSRQNFTRPVKFDSTVNIKGYLFDSSTVVNTLAPQVITPSKYWTARQYMTSLAVDTMTRRTSGNFLVAQSGLKLSGSILSTRFLFASSTGSMWVGTSAAPSDFDTLNLGSNSYVFGKGLVTGQYSFSAGSSGRVTGDYSSVFGDGNQTSGSYNFLSGQSMKTDSVNYVNLSGFNIRALRRTLGGFAYSNTGDSIRFGHATISGGVPFVSHSFEGTAGNSLNEFILSNDASVDSSSFAIRQVLGVRNSGGTSTTSLELAKFKNTSASNFDKYDGNKYLVWGRVDTSNNILFNAEKSADFTYGDMYLSNGHFLVSQGYADADSFRLNGSTFLNSTALSLGSKTVTTTGAGSFGAGKFTGDITDSSASPDIFLKGTNTAGTGNLYFYNNDSLKAYISYRPYGASSGRQMRISGTSVGTSLLFEVGNEADALLLDASANATFYGSVSTTGAGSFGALSGTTITGSGLVKGTTTAGATSAVTGFRSTNSVGLGARIGVSLLNSSSSEVTYLQLGTEIKRNNAGTETGEGAVFIMKSGVLTRAATFDTSLGLLVGSSATTGGGNITTTGNLSIGAITSTGLSLLDSIKTTTIKPISTGGAPIVGNATMVAGTITVNTTAVKANSVVMITRKTSGGTIGTAITYTITAGTSFTINSDSILDTSTFSWFILTPY